MVQNLDMPNRRGRSGARISAPRCGRHTKRGTPCRLPQEVVGGCRHHATASEHEAVAKAAQERAAKFERTARRQGWAAVISLSTVTLAMLAGLASCGVSAWQDHQRESACEPYRTKALTLDQQAAKVKIPLISSFDSGIRNLQLGRSFPASLGELDAVGATETEISEAYRRKRELAGQAAKVVLEHRNCMPGFIEAATHIKNSPAGVTWVEMPSAGRCADGWASGSIGRQGACSHHGGVVYGNPLATLHFD